MTLDVLTHFVVNCDGPGCSECVGGRDDRSAVIEEAVAQGWKESLSNPLPSGEYRWYCPHCVEQGVDR